MKKFYIAIVFISLCLDINGMDTLEKSIEKKFKKFEKDVKAKLEKGSSVDKLIRSGSINRKRPVRSESVGSDDASSSAASSGSNSPKSLKIKRTSPDKKDKKIQEVMHKVSSYQKEYKDRNIDENKKSLAGILYELLSPYWESRDKNWFLAFITRNTEFRFGVDLKDFLEKTKTPEDILSYVKIIINLPLDQTNTTLLMEASRLASNFELIQNLLFLGADPNLQDEFGYTALGYLVRGKVYLYNLDLPKRYNTSNEETKVLEKRYFRDLIALFVNYGADLDLKDKEGKTVLDLAKKFNLTNLVEAL